MAPQQPVTNPVLDELDTTTLPKPFKNPHWKPAARRNKNLKQILQEANRAQAALLNPPVPVAATAPAPSTSDPATASASAPPPPPPPPPSKPAQSFMGPTFTNIESAPSLHPARAHWCDITGLPARYTDPKTKLRYADKEVYKAIGNLPPGNAEGYLELRGANVILK